MTGIDARPRSASEIVDSAFNVLRQRYGAYVTASAIMYIPVIVLRLAGYGFGDYPPAGGTITDPQLAGLLFQLAWISITNAALAIMTSQVFVGGEADPGSAIPLALRRAVPILLSGLVTMLLAGLGTVFFLIPGIYLFSRYGLSPVVAAIEGTGPFASMSRASLLSTNNKLHYLATLILVVVLYLIVSAVTGFLFALGKVPAVSIVAGAAVTIFLLPFVGTVNALIYYDLRIRNEGYDIQLMSERLAEQPVPATS